MSKLHGVFLWLGFGGYIIFHRRDLLKSPMLWISGILSLVVISPIYWWNYENHFITYQYHQDRISFWGKQPDLDHLLQQVLGSVFYNNPVNFILYVHTLYLVAKRKSKLIPKEYPLLLWLSLPLILLLIWTSLFSDTLPHWSGPAYLSLMVLAACWLEEKCDPLSTLKWLRTAGWVYICVLLLGVYAILYFPFQIGSSQEKNLGKGDPGLDMSGWKNNGTAAVRSRSGNERGGSRELIQRNPTARRAAAGDSRGPLILPLTHVGMLAVELRRILVLFRHRQNFRLTEKPPNKTDAGRGSALGEPVRQHDAWMAREIAQQQTLPAL
jgi:hypothetical protein